ncbi:MAG: DNA-directed RNA polymerase subunit omega [candidate division Zixibacteria bacterium]|nr:DNA-directed RNA polymerase subunit omega [candidate division Zixibacteria bacterium]MCK4607068.1 DNA-directed RNA polymerase subunit omega [candidate division Zixibacteria bacterium]
MPLFSIEDISKLDLNSYEAVIVASQHARRLNAVRLAALERMEEDPEVQIDARKITMVALREVLEGKVKFERPDSM